MGIKKSRSVVQLNGMDQELRNGLWNVLDRYLFRSQSFDEDYFTEVLWWHFFKRPVDQRPISHSMYGGSDDYSDVWAEIRSFFFSCKWNEVYDFIEFVLQVKRHDSRLRQLIDSALERESSGFRIIDDRFCPISDEIEVKEILAALDERFSGVAEHLKASIKHLTDRDSPDFRNSIKESISAVEAMAKVVTGSTRATLDDALKTMEKDGRLHPALKSAFSKMYGYTSDADGIRHALVDDSGLKQADARYFLIVCSAFINLLKTQVH